MATPLPRLLLEKPVKLLAGKARYAQQAVKACCPRLLPALYLRVCGMVAPHAAYCDQAVQPNTGNLTLALL